MRVRVLAYNVRGFRAGARRVAAAVADEAPDVAMLSEIGRTGLRLRSFAKTVGMEAALGLRFWRRGVPGAVLVRPPWRLVADGIVHLSQRRPTIPRGLVIAVVGRGGYRLTAVAFHLGLSDDERVEHARELTDRVPSLRQPVVIGGDANEAPEDRASTWLAERLWDAWTLAGEGQAETYPAGEPRARIDYVFVSHGVRVERAWVKKDASDASDHLPVFADVQIG